MHLWDMHEFFQEQQVLPKANQVLTRGANGSDKPSFAPNKQNGFFLPFIDFTEDAITSRFFSKSREIDGSF